MYLIVHLNVENELSFMLELSVGFPPEKGEIGKSGKTGKLVFLLRFLKKYCSGVIR